MNISATFIRKPIATGMLMAVILLLGLISYELLPVAALPNIDSPTILVTAHFRAPMRRLLPVPLPRRSNGSSARSPA